MTRMVSRLLLLAILSAGAAIAQAAAPASYDNTIQQAESLIHRGDSGKAYSLLEPLEPQLAGNVRYDYLFGVSAVNAGKSSRAVFALERVLAVSPGYRNVGLWLAIAYYNSGDRERARTRFQAVAAGSGDAEAKAKAERYLAVMDEEDASMRSSLRGTLEIGVGHDSNITNLSPDYASAQQFAAAVPAPATNQSSMESILGVGVEGRLAYSSGYWFASANEERRDYADNHNMTSNTVIARAGVNSIGRNTYRVNVMQRQFRQLGAFYILNGLNNDYIITGAEGSAKLRITDNNVLGLYVQYSQIRFDVNNVEDTNQEMGGVSYTRMIQVSGNPVFYLGYAHYLNQAVRPKPPMNIVNTAEGEMSTDAGRKTDVATLYLQYSLASDLDLYSTNFYYYRQDTGAYARSATVAYGIDKIRYLSLGAIWRFLPKWSMRAQLANTRNTSNIAFYSYGKTEATLVFRREFN